MKAPERYTIGELTDADRDAFEEHFACCSRCMDELSALTTFAANARAVFRDRAVAAERAASPKKRAGLWAFRWQFAIPALAAMALAAVVVYQTNVIIPSLMAPQGFVPAVVLDGTTRSTLPQVRQGAPLRFQMPLAQAAQSGQVWAELIGPSGRTASAGWVKVAPGSDTLDVFFPVHPDPGRYTVVVRAGQADGAELARNRFEITRQDPPTP
ncbi:MAG TPA: zf-HC2 domain-containing protein [Bryobacteraceae bacterium]|nr:zf-HC2 domain-containing protein [Bryobacteraceae bacterium]